MNDATADRLLALLTQWGQDYPDDVAEDFTVTELVDDLTQSTMNGAIATEALEVWKPGT